MRTGRADGVALGFGDGVAACAPAGQSASDASAHSVTRQALIARERCKGCAAGRAGDDDLERSGMLA